LGASIVDPKTKASTHVEIISQPERYTINRAKLAAITTALDLSKHASTLSILTDSAFIINNLRNYSSDPHNFIHHQHKDLLHLADNNIHTRDDLGYTTSAKSSPILAKPTTTKRIRDPAALLRDPKPHTCRHNLYSCRPAHWKTAHLAPNTPP
jgi:hypothetical protein